MFLFYFTGSRQFYTYPSNKITVFWYNRCSTRKDVAKLDSNNFLNLVFIFSLSCVFVTVLLRDNSWKMFVFFILNTQQSNASNHQLAVKSLRPQRNPPIIYLLNQAY
jgi:hypothetical protein